jgi:hypothetical protein
MHPTLRIREGIVGVALVGAALLACKKKDAPAPSTDTPAVSTTRVRHSELAPKLKARIETLAGIGKTAASEPKLKKEKPIANKLDKKQFVIVGDKWLDNVHYDQGPEELDLEDTKLAACEYAIDEESPDDDDVSYMDECLAWEYVAVIRPRKIVLPVIKMASKTFEPGQLDGDLLLFDLSSGEIVGRYLLGITNSDELKWFEGKPEEDWKTESKRDLVQNVRAVIEERLAQTRDSSGTPD